MVTVIIDWKNWNSNYTRTKEEFENEEEFEKFMENSISDHRIRKPIKIQHIQ